MVYPYTVEDQLHCHRNMARDVNDIEMALISKLSFSYRIQKLEKKQQTKQVGIGKQEMIFTYPIGIRHIAKVD